MSTVRLVSTREGQEEEQAVVCPHALHPAHTNEDAFHTLVEASEALARAHGKEELVVHVNARHTWALVQVLRAGHRVRGGLLRMVLAGTDMTRRTHTHVDLSRWAG